MPGEVHAPPVYQGSYAVQLLSTGLIRFGISTAGNSINNSVSSTTVFQSGDYVHIACGRNNSTGAIYIYVNGVSEGAAAAPATYNSTASLTIGNRYDGTDQPATGTEIFDARIYNLPFTAALAKELYDSHGRDNLLSGLVLRTCIKNGISGTSLSGQTVHDHSTYKNHITATGSLTVASDPYSIVKPIHRM